MREQRMYFFVPYNISEIQKGIQAGHAALEYAWEFQESEAYESFIENDKTWIILNGGTTNSNVGDVFYGSMNSILDSLNENEIPHSTFEEPDMNNALSAICFLVDELVFGKDDEGKDLVSPRKIWERKYLQAIKKDPNIPVETYEEYVLSFDGATQETIFLKDLLTSKKLA